MADWKWSEGQLVNGRPKRMSSSSTYGINEWPTKGYIQRQLPWVGNDSVGRQYYEVNEEVLGRLKIKIPIIDPSGVKMIVLLPDQETEWPLEGDLVTIQEQSVVSVDWIHWWPGEGVAIVQVHYRLSIDNERWVDDKRGIDN